MGTNVLAGFKQLGGLLGDKYMDNFSVKYGAPYNKARLTSDGDPCCLLKPVIFFLVQSSRQLSLLIDPVFSPIQSSHRCGRLAREVPVAARAWNESGYG